MRIGKRMREILEALKYSDKPITLTEIIMKIKGFEHHKEMWYSGSVFFRETKNGKEIIRGDDYEEHFFIPIQKKLASAIAGKRIPSFDIFSRILLTYAEYQNKDDPYIKQMREKDLAERDYIKEADKLYATYKRSIKILWEYGLVNRTKAIMINNKIKNQRIIYEITEKGKERLKA